MLATLCLAGAFGMGLPAAAAAWLAVWVMLSLAAFASRMFGRELGRPGWSVALIDLALGLVLVRLSGPRTSPLWGSLLVAVLINGLANGRRGASIMALLGATSAAALSMLDGESVAAALPVACGYFGLLLVCGLGLGQLTDRVRRKGLAIGDRQVLEAGRPWTGERRRRGRDAFRLAAELNATLEFDQVAELAVRLSGRLLSDSGREEERLARLLLVLADDHLSIAAAQRLSPAECRLTFPKTEGLIGEVVATGEARLLHEPALDPILQQLPSLRNARVVLCVPVVSGLGSHGVMVFAHPQEDYFTAEKVDTLQAIGQQAAIALQNAKVYQDLALEKQRFTEIQEDARRKLARDLHDGPTQAVATIAMRVNYARRLLGKSQASAIEELSKIEDLARRTTRDIRHVLFTLRPLILESRGLVAALDQLADKVRDTHNQRVIVRAEPEVVEGMDLSRQAVLFYIAEEAINNARKHAQAPHIWVRLDRRGEFVVLEVQDDGVGFNVGAVDASYEQRGSLGMVNMRERTQLVNGQFHIESAEGKGTRITVTVPIEGEVAEPIADDTSRPVG